MSHTLATSKFVDLYIGKDFADVKGLSGSYGSRAPTPDDWGREIQSLRLQCVSRLQETKAPEFSVVQDGVVYRVTHLEGISSGGVFVLRRSEAEIRDPRSLGLPKFAVNAILSSGAVGLVLICGGMGAGKTTSAASFVVERLRLHGGIALGIEDPTETNIDGVHGGGRCIAISASRYNGGYKEHLIRGLRSGVDFIFIGEIRDEETAFEALKAGGNGKLIIATIHGASEILAMERMITLASKHTSSACEMLADSLYAVVWQKIDEVPKAGGGTFRRLISSSLVVTPQDAPAIREKIRRNELSSLSYEIDRQSNLQIWGEAQ